MLLCLNNVAKVQKKLANLQINGLFFFPQYDFLCNFAALNYEIV